eukprot:NODE_586_length_6373_cov_0.635480.p4 type:complete len:142 gc:universal NODE_586_length_6373_cov_0.635480:1262-837(-)
MFSFSSNPNILRGAPNKMDSFLNMNLYVLDEKSQIYYFLDTIIQAFTPPNPKLFLSWFSNSDCKPRHSSNTPADPSKCPMYFLYATNLALGQREAMACFSTSSPISVDVAWQFAKSICILLVLFKAFSMQRYAPLFPGVVM